MKFIYIPAGNLPDPPPLTDLSKPEQLERLNGFLREVATLANRKNHVIIEDIVIPVGDFTLRHNLGRTPVGVAMVSQDAATVVTGAKRGSWNAQTMVVTSGAGAPFTCSLGVF